MENEKILAQLEVQEKQLHDISTKIHRMYVAFIVTVVVTIVTFIVPLIGLIFVIPWAMHTIGDVYSGLL